MKPADSERLVAHAANCSHCGPLLRECAQDFAVDVSSDEDAVLSRLRSARPEWRQQLIAELCPRQPKRRIPQLSRLWPSGSFLRWSYAGAVAALAGGGFWIVQTMQQPGVETLLARAYTEQRPMEMRMPGADYGPVRLLRGSANRSRLSRPSSLLEGEARIARELAQRPNDPTLLAERGAAELLDGDYDAAIATLTRARDLGINSPSLLLNLASAYFGRGELTRSSRDYSVSLELLDGVLKNAPHEPTASFNRAIVLERLGSTDQAILAWQQYLRIDPKSSWSAEASTRLSRLQQNR
jgi:tetratricopeptide (TPR) repeat protein